MNLSHYFTRIVAKRLSHSEINSNQHELNGTVLLRDILSNELNQNIIGKIVYLTDNEDEIISNDCTFSWYDARINNPNRSPEYRLYYSDNEIISEKSFTDDLVLICFTPANEIIVFIVAKDSTIESQLLSLLNISQIRRTLSINNIQIEQIHLDFVKKNILSYIGIEATERVTDEAIKYLDNMIALFGGTFPTTIAFSAYARGTFEENEIDVINNPDEALMLWWNREGELMELFENHILQPLLDGGFENKEAFLKTALSVVNRRKSRAGHSLENHLKVIFETHGLDFTKGGKTEGNSKPDYLFPNIEAYHDETFDVAKLTLLGVKTTAKDRWRQVLAEGAKILNKHLITLEPAISIAQTTEMTNNNLTLVIPTPVQEKYKPEQLEYIISLKQFIEMVKAKI